MTIIAEKMPTAKNAVAVDQKLRPKSARKPLQPKNFQAHPSIEFAKPKTYKQENSKLPLAAPNNPISASPAKIETFDASLAEELSAIKKRLERLRIDRDKTEMFLKEKDSILDLKRKEIDHRGEIQKKLEIEVDRLYRLNQLHSQAMVRFSPIKSLREKERTKVVSESESKEVKTEDKEESVGESSCSAEELISTASTKLVVENK